MSDTPRKIFHIEMYEPATGLATFYVEPKSPEALALQFGGTGARLIEFQRPPAVRAGWRPAKPAETLSAGLATSAQARMDAARSAALESALRVAREQRDDYARRLDALHVAFSQLSDAFTSAMKGISAIVPPAPDCPEA